MSAHRKTSMEDRSVSRTRGIVSSFRLLKGPSPCQVHQSRCFDISKVRATCEKHKTVELIRRSFSCIKYIVWNSRYNGRDYLVDDLIDSSDSLTTRYLPIHSYHRLEHQVLHHGQCTNKQIILLHIGHSRSEYTWWHPSAIGSHQTRREYPAWTKR